MTTPLPEAWRRTAPSPGAISLTAADLEALGYDPAPVTEAWQDPDGWVYRRIPGERLAVSRPAEREAVNRCVFRMLREGVGEVGAGPNRTAPLPVRDEDKALSMPAANERP